MANIKEVEVGLGLSVEVGGHWHKLNARIVVEMDEKDNKKKREQVFNQAWEEVTIQVHKKLEEIING